MSTQPQPTERLAVFFLEQLAEKLLDEEGPEDRREAASRIKRCKDPKEFCKTYLPKHFSAPFGEHHDDLFAVMRKMGIGLHVVRAEPRDHGKSTTMLIGCVLWTLAYKLKNFILLIGAGQGAVGPHFLAMQSELDPDTGNKLLLRDFPHLRPKIDFKGQLEKWTDTKIKLQSGATAVVSTLYSGFRGMKEDEHRPDLIIMDDPQDEDGVTTSFKRMRAVSRVKNTILSLGSSKCDYVIEGNLMHRESIIGTFLKDSNWDAKLYKAYNLPIRPDEDFPVGNTKEDGSPLWDVKWPKERLEKKQAQIGGRAFDLEYLNVDRPQTDIIYDSAQFRRFDLKPGLSLKGYDVVVYWDPSTGKRPGVRSSGDSLDPAAIVVGASRKLKSPVHESPIRFYWILDARVERMVPEEQIETALNYLKFYPATRLYYADTGGFAVLTPFIRRRAKELGIRVPLQAVQESGNKFQRIANDGMQMILKTRTFFSSSLPAVYFRQWDDFPDPGAHDDGPDATVGLIEQFERRFRRMF